MGTAGHRWVEQEAPPPTDLRVVIPALAVWAGCLVGIWASAWAWWIGGSAVVGVALGAVSHTIRRRMAGVAAAVMCFGSAIVIATGAMHAASTDPLVVAGHAGAWVTADLVVSSDPAPVASRFAGAGNGDGGQGGAGQGGAGSDRFGSEPTRWRITGSSERVTVRGVAVVSDVAVVLFADGARWGAVTPGERVRVQGEVAPDTFHAIPGVVVRALGEPTVLGDPPWWSAWASSARASLARSSAALDEDPGGLLRGLVVGDTRAISEELSADAKSTGLTHLLAVSGSHMSIIGGVVMLLLRRFGPRVASTGVVFSLVGIVVLVGPAPSVLRAAVMGLVGVIAVMMGRTRSALPALAGAVFLLLLLDPALAVSIGFTLSVQATAGLVLLAPGCIRALERQGVPRGWAALIALPVVAHIVTMPVVTAISGRISLVAIPANIIVTPVVAPALLIGMVCLLVSLVWAPAGEVLARCDGPFLSWITGTAHHLARWPVATVPWPASTAGVLTLAVLVLVGLAVFRHRSGRAVLAAATVGALLIIIPARVAAVGWPVDGWLMTVCDVGQGDGLVLSTGVVGQAVVIDAGPDPDAMDACLARLGVTAIPLLVVTHLHADHIDGLPGALRGRAVAAIGLGPGRAAWAGFAEVRKVAAAHRVPVSSMLPGTHRTIGKLELTVLGPRRVFHGTKSDANNNSVVIMASRGGVRILLTGDIERPAQRSLLRSGVDLRADVLKQPHHGSSKLLPAFVAAISPRVAVVSVGADNDYGHPAESALATDSRAGVVRILRTDTDGDIQISVTQRGLSTATRGPRLESGRISG